MKKLIFTISVLFVMVFNAYSTESTQLNNTTSSAEIKVYVAVYGPEIIASYPVKVIVYLQIKENGIWKSISSREKTKLGPGEFEFSFLPVPFGTEYRIQAEVTINYGSFAQLTTYLYSPSRVYYGVMESISLFYR